MCDVTSYWCSVPRCINSLALQTEPWDTVRDTFIGTLLQTHIHSDTLLKQTYFRPTPVFPLTTSLFHCYLFLDLSCFKLLFCSVWKHDVYNTKWWPKLMVTAFQREHNYFRGGETRMKRKETFIRVKRGHRKRCIWAQYTFKSNSAQRTFISWMWLFRTMKHLKLEKLEHEEEKL